jgi:cytochrome b
MASETAHAEASVSKRVWDAPVRLTHWAMVLLLIVLVASALIGGNAMDWHVRAGEAMLSLVIFRIVWGVVGSPYARFSSFVHGPAKVIAYARSILRPPHEFHIGHNPLGGWMVILLLLALLVQATTGLFSNDDVLTEGPLVRFITKDLSDAISSIHRKNAWFVIGLACLHIGAVLFYLIALRENLIRPMIAGIKDIPSGYVSAAHEGTSRNALAAVLFAICACAVWFLVTRR